MKGENLITLNFTLKEEKDKGEKMEEKEVLQLLIDGYYSKWFFDVLLTNLTLFVKNNLPVLILFAVSWQRVSRFTKGKWDDRASNWLVNRLTRQKKENGGVIPRNPKEE